MLVAAIKVGNVHHEKAIRSETRISGSVSITVTQVVVPGRAGARPGNLTARPGAPGSGSRAQQDDISSRATADGHIGRGTVGRILRVTEPRLGTDLIETHSWPRIYLLLFM